MTARAPTLQEPVIARTDSKHKPAAMVSVYDGRRCVGFVLARGQAGFESFTADQVSLGTFPTQHEAAAALRTEATP
jgi:hypothetical protein